MTKAKLSGECLKFMRDAYKESEKELFTMDDFVEAIPEASRKELTRALKGAGTVKDVMGWVIGLL